MLKEHIVHLFNSIRYSLYGLKAILSETAFRQELILAIPVFCLAWLPILQLPMGLRVTLTVAWLALMTVEILNTAIETVVNYISTDIHPLAKKAKDLGSAAVFMTVIINGILWLYAFYTAYVAYVSAP